MWSDDEEGLGKMMSSAAAMQDRESGAGGGADDGGVLGRSRAISDRSRNLGSLRATGSPRSGAGSGSEGGVGSGGSANGMNSSWKKKGASGNGTPSAGGVPSGLLFFSPPVFTCSREVLRSFLAC